MANSVFFLKGRFESPGEMDQGYGWCLRLTGRSRKRGRNWSAGCHRSPEGCVCRPAGSKRPGKLLQKVMLPGLAPAPQAQAQRLVVSSGAGGSALGPHRNPTSSCASHPRGAGMAREQYKEGTLVPHSRQFNPFLSCPPCSLHLFWLLQLGGDPENTLGKRGIAVGSGRMWKGLFYFVHSVFLSILPLLVFGEGRNVSYHAVAQAEVAWSAPGPRAACSRVGGGARACTRRKARGRRARAHCVCFKQGLHCSLRSKHVCFSLGPDAWRPSTATEQSMQGSALPGRR